MYSAYMTCTYFKCTCTYTLGSLAWQNSCTCTSTISCTSTSELHAAVVITLECFPRIGIFLRESKYMYMCIIHIHGKTSV